MTPPPIDDQSALEAWLIDVLPDIQRGCAVAVPPSVVSLVDRFAGTPAAGEWESALVAAVDAIIDRTVDRRIGVEVFELPADGVRNALADIKE